MPTSGAVPGRRVADLVDWLGFVRGRASHLVLNGDIFDFWFEYRRAIPRGHVRLLGAIAETVDAGVPVTFLGGNHDWWGGSCLSDEIGVAFHRAPIRTSLAGRTAYIAHGDGLGRGDHGYRIASGILRARLFRRLFRSLHPDLGGRLAGWLSRSESHEGPADEGTRRRARATRGARRTRTGAGCDPRTRGVRAHPCSCSGGGWGSLLHKRRQVDAERSYAVIEASGPPRIEYWKGRPAGE